MRPEIPGEALAAISAELVRLKAQRFGKGPVEAKTYVNDNFVFCVMRGGLTVVEKTMVHAGDADLIRELRLRFQARLAEPFCSAVERITGFAVLAYESQILFDPDYTVEIFVLGRRHDARTPEGEESQQT
ncbi:MAG: DUF2294 domain-containing protein [Actinomycetota bacterium]|nr:DUF2294 domain-containing protein [Actinomycetota bacterium]